MSNTLIGKVVSANDDTMIDGEKMQNGRRGLVIGFTPTPTGYPHEVRWETTGIIDYHDDTEIDVIA